MTPHELIHAALEKCGGSKSRLATELGCQRTEINAWMTARKMSPQTVGLLCNYLNIPQNTTRELVDRAVVATAKPKYQKALEHALFGCWVAGVATLLIATTAPNTAMAAEVTKGYRTNIVAAMRRFLAAVLNGRSASIAAAW